MKQVIEDVLHPARAFEHDHPNLLHRIYEYLEKYDGAERTKEHIVRFEQTKPGVTSSGVNYWRY